MLRRTLPRAATLILALTLTLTLTLTTTPLLATPSLSTREPGLLATLWQSLLEIILPDAAPAPTENPAPPEQPEGDLGPTLDPIG